MVILGLTVFPVLISIYSWFHIKGTLIQWSLSIPNGTGICGCFSWNPRYLHLYLPPLILYLRTGWTRSTFVFWIPFRTFQSRRSQFDPGPDGYKNQSQIQNNQNRLDRAGSFEIVGQGNREIEVHGVPRIIFNFWFCRKYYPALFSSASFEFFLLILL